MAGLFWFTPVQTMFYLFIYFGLQIIKVGFFRMKIRPFKQVCVAFFFFMFFLSDVCTDYIVRQGLGASPEKSRAN